MRARADPCTSKDHIRGAAVCPSPVTRSCDERGYFAVPRSVLDELPSGEPRLEVMPVADVAPLTQLPAEVNLAAAVLRAEVDEAAVGILHLDAELGDVLEDGVDLLRDRVGGTSSVRDSAALQL